MFCKNCGEQIDDNAVICPKCGCATDNYRANGKAQPAADDAPSAGFSVLCFFFPLIGLILYLIWKDTLPLRARSCGKGALIGVIVAVALSIFGTVIVGVLFGSVMGGMYGHGHMALLMLLA